MVSNKQTSSIVFWGSIQGLAEAFSVIRTPQWII